MIDSILAAGVLEETIRAFFQGLPIGAGFALVAMSFVLTYKTSGVFNLAFGAQAFISAATYFELHVRRDWPIWAAVLVAVVLVAPLLGLLLERLIFRHIHAASAVAKLVISLGLMVALPALFKLAVDYNREQPFGAVGIIPDGTTVYRLFGRYPVTRDEIAAFAIMVAAALALAALFRYSRLGLRIRAVVQSPRMTELNGVNADWVSSGSWMLSSLFAGLAGVLLVPTTSSLGTVLEPSGYFPIVISALAAAALGRLVNLPAALVGGLLLGVVTTEMRTHLPRDNVILNELRGSALPYVMLFAIIVFWPAIRRQIAGADPLLGVAPPPHALAATNRSRGMTIYTRIMALVFFTAVGIWTFGYANNYWISLITHSVIFTIIFLSIVVFTGLGGQIALCQVTFAAIGAFGAMQFAQRWDVSVMVGMLAGAAIAAAVGAVLSVPVMRLGGIWLAIATLAFALFFNDVLVKYGWVGGSLFQGRRVPRPQFLGVDFTQPQELPHLVHRHLGGGERFGDPHPREQHRHGPSGAAGLGDRGRVHRGDRLAVPGHRVLGVGRRRRHRRGTVGHGGAPGQLRGQLRPPNRPVLAGDRGGSRRPHRGGRHPGRDRLRDLPRAGARTLAAPRRGVAVRAVRLRRHLVRPPSRGPARARQAPLAEHDAADVQTP